jgi:hypothetical protein
LAASLKLKVGHCFDTAEDVFDKAMKYAKSFRGAMWPGKSQMKGTVLHDFDMDFVEVVGAA